MEKIKEQVVSGLALRPVRSSLGEGGSICEGGETTRKSLSGGRNIVDNLYSNFFV